jgi:hypothetical protein
MPEVGFETTLTAYEREKIVYASDRFPTMTGTIIINLQIYEELSMDII